MEWIACKDRLPTDEEGDYFLIYGEDEDGDKEIYKAYLGHDTCWYWRDMEFSHVTHWCPLPEPPKTI